MLTRNSRRFVRRVVVLLLARAFPSLFLMLISATIPIFYPYRLNSSTGSVRIHVGTLTDFFLGLGKETIIGWQRDDLTV